MEKDGLNNLNYKLNQIAEHQGYTHVYADLLFYTDKENREKL